MARLALTDVQKSFGPTKALHGVALTVPPGEVHGLLGENGAGKSTLLNILCGVLSARSGKIAVDGVKVSISSPHDATAAGIAMIHQELQQIPELTVAQDVYLGHALRRGIFVDRAKQEAEAKRLLFTLDPGIDVTAPIGTLRVAQRQIVVIAKALSVNAKIIAMDEPTSSLNPADFEKLVAVIAKLSARVSAPSTSLIKWTRCSASARPRSCHARGSDFRHFHPRPDHRGQYRPSRHPIELRFQCLHFSKAYAAATRVLGSG